MENPLGRDVSHIKVTAAVAVLVLVGAGALQVIAFSNQKTSAGTFVAGGEAQNGAQNAAVIETLNATPTDPITSVSDQAVGEVVGAYAELEQSGAYSSTTGVAIGTSIGLGLQAPVTYAQINPSNVQTTPDTSYKAMMQYRTALQTTLKPLLQNTTPEYEIWGMYVETQQQQYLDQLSAAAANYSAAASSTAALTVPADAVQVQIGLVNSMNEFATTLNDMVAHANDTIASTVLLENYNQAENDVLTAFQALVTYEQSKTQ